jgi:hypothetical protein
MKGMQFLRTEPLMPNHREPPDSIAQDSTPHNPVKISRRRFGRDAAAMAALTVSPASLLGAEGDRGPASSVSTAPPGQTHSADYSKLGITPEQATEVEAKLANIVRKFGSRLSPEQREHLRRILAYNERMLAGVRSFELQNGDPPASVLRISPLREVSPGGARHGGTSAKPAGQSKKPKGAR